VLFPSARLKESVTVFVFVFLNPCVPFIVPAQSTSLKSPISVADDKAAFDFHSNASDKIAPEVRIDLLMKRAEIFKTGMDTKQKL